MARAPKLTMSSAPSGDDLGEAEPPGRLEPVRAGGEHAADEVVAQLGGGDVEHAVEEARLHQPLHRAAAGAGGVEHEHLVAALLQRLARVRDARRGDAEHRRRDQRPLLAELDRRRLQHARPSRPRRWRGCAPEIELTPATSVTDAISVTSLAPT